MTPAQRECSSGARKHMDELDPITESVPRVRGFLAERHFNHP
jgi:hypothetical protein